jgi:DNA-binding MltR family transcriptional regulator
MPTLSELSKFNEVEIEIFDEEIQMEFTFHCTLPHQRLLMEALNSAQKKGKQTDATVWAKKLFLNCVNSWSLDEDCNDENKNAFFADDATLNRIAQSLCLNLMHKAQGREKAEEGN